MPETAVEELRTARRLVLSIATSIDELAIVLRTVQPGLAKLDRTQARHGGVADPLANPDVVADMLAGICSRVSCDDSCNEEGGVRMCDRLLRRVLETAGVPS